jgi:hypothetical protein
MYLDTMPHQGLISNNLASLILGAIETIANVNAAHSAMWPLHGEKDAVEGYFWELMCSWLELVVP